MIRRFNIWIDDQKVEVEAGTNLAVALLHARAGRTSVKGEPREPMCGMGICWECKATVDGEPNVRTCMRSATAGMKVRTDG